MVRLLLIVWTKDAPLRRKEGPSELVGRPRATRAVDVEARLGVSAAVTLDRPGHDGISQLFAEELRLRIDEDGRCGATAEIAAQ